MSLSTLRQFTWELPQTLLGYILTKIYKDKLYEVKEYNHARVHYYKEFPGGISLGRYILVQDCSWFPEYQEELVKHEFGHCIQSKYLGWFYLPIVGICSGIHSLTYKTKMEAGTITGYYDYWTERWADKLGGVKRGWK